MTAGTGSAGLPLGSRAETESVSGVGHKAGRALCAGTCFVLASIRTTFKSVSRHPGMIIPCKFQQREVSHGFKAVQVFVQQ